MHPQRDELRKALTVPGSIGDQRERFVMNGKSKTGFALVLGVCVMAGCSPEPEVSFQADVKPILDKHCKSCHTEGGAGYTASGLKLDSYEDLMKGTKYGPIVLAGDSMSSTLNVLVEGRADESIRMPHTDTDALNEDEIETLKLWVDQGAKDN